MYIAMMPDVVIFARRCNTELLYCDFVKYCVNLLEPIRIFVLYSRNWSQPNSLRWYSISFSFQHISVVFNISFTFLFLFFWKNILINKSYSLITSRDCWSEPPPRTLNERLIVLVSKQRTRRLARKETSGKSNTQYAQ